MCTGVCGRGVCTRACASAASPHFPTNPSSQSTDSFTHRGVRRLWSLPSQKALFRAVLCLVQGMTALAGSLESQISHILCKAGRLFSSSIVHQQETVSREQQVLVHLSLLQPVASPPSGSPPSLLSPSPALVLFPFLVILELPSSSSLQGGWEYGKRISPWHCAVCNVPFRMSGSEGRVRSVACLVRPESHSIGIFFHEGI